MSVRNLGAKVRAQRRARAITQVELARRLGISPSYLNLIEHDQRPVTAELLIKLATEFDLDLKDFTAAQDARLGADLMEVFADPLFEEQALNSAEVRELAISSPSTAKAVLALYRAYQAARDDAAGLASRVYDEQELTGSEGSVLPNEEINDIVQRHMNHFPRIERAAESFVDELGMRVGGRFAAMAAWCAGQGIGVVIGRSPSEPGTPPGVQPGVVRRYDPAQRRIFLDEAMPPHTRLFQLAAQIALLREGQLLDRLVHGEALGDDTAQTLAKVVLANYFAGAVLMPYRQFLEAARSVRYDIELLSARFGTGYEQVCHRLTTLRRKGAEGIPFHMIRVDLAGNISKRFSASGIRFARFSGSCPRWNVFSAFQTPGRVRVQLSEMPGGEVYFCMARTVPKGPGGYHAPHTVQAVGLGCQIQYAREMVYSDGIDLDTLQGVVPVGVTCRLCERTGCEQRVLPSLRTRLHVDENVRTRSFYASSE